VSLKTIRPWTKQNKRQKNKKNKAKQKTKKNKKQKTKQNKRQKKQKTKNKNETRQRTIHGPGEHQIRERPHDGTTIVQYYRSGHIDVGSWNSRRRPPICRSNWN
jgi:outer membrane biosynthesis protein TonB